MCLSLAALGKRMFKSGRGIPMKSLQGTGLGSKVRHSRNRNQNRQYEQKFCTWICEVLFRNRPIYIQHYYFNVTSASDNHHLKAAAKSVARLDAYILVYGGELLHNGHIQIVDFVVVFCAWLLALASIMPLKKYSTGPQCLEPGQ